MFYGFFLQKSNVIVDYCRGLRTNITNDRMLEFKNKSTEIQLESFYSLFIWFLS